MELIRRLDEGLKSKKKFHRDDYGTVHKDKPRKKSGMKNKFKRFSKSDSKKKIGTKVRADKKADKFGMIHEIDESLEERRGKRQLMPKGTRPMPKGHITKKSPSGHRHKSSHKKDKKSIGVQKKQDRKDLKFGINLDEGKAHWVKWKTGPKKKGKELTKQQTRDLLKKHRKEIDKKSKDIEKTKYPSSAEVKKKYKKMFTKDDRRKLKNLGPDIQDPDIIETKDNESDIKKIFNYRTNWGNPGGSI